MSTLRVDNLQASDGLSPAFVTAGIAKAAVVYDQVTPATDESFNVSSVSDDATGVYTTNFTNDFANANYASSAGVKNRTSTLLLAIGNTTTRTAPTASALQVVVASLTSTALDIDDTSLVMTGDLA